MLAAMAAVPFAAISLMSGELAAQTASSNGKIVYSGFDHTLGDDRLGQEDIYTMNPDGTGDTNLTQNYSMPNWSPLGEAKDNPEWSPDGTQITFMSRRSGQEDIWVVDAPPTTPSAPVALLPLSLGAKTAWAASEPRNLTPGGRLEAYSPDWGTAPPSVGTSCTIKGTSGVDVLRGGSGTDTIEGGSGADELYGGDGADSLHAADGVRGNDASSGGPGADSCKGDRGDDKTGCP